MSVWLLRRNWELERTEYEYELDSNKDVYRFWHINPYEAIITEGPTWISTTDTDT